MSLTNSDLYGESRRVFENLIHGSKVPYLDILCENTRMGCGSAGRMENIDVKVDHWGRNNDMFNAFMLGRFGIMNLEYKEIIFNYPATIVNWKDGTKTVVRCQEGDEFDPEKGIALCFMKKALGNKGNFNNILKKEVSKYSESKRIAAIGISCLNGLSNGLASVTQALDHFKDRLKDISKAQKQQKNFYQIKFLKKNKLHINKFEDSGDTIKEVEWYNIPDVPEFMYNLVRENFYQKGRLVDRKRTFCIRFEDDFVINIDGIHVGFPSNQYVIAKQIIEKPKIKTASGKIRSEADNEQNEDS